MFGRSRSIIVAIVCRRRSRPPSSGIHLHIGIQQQRREWSLAVRKGILEVVVVVVLKLMTERRGKIKTMMTMVVRRIPR